jgi:dTDP-4-amino-4,6-dideoxygalactose transaminase
VTGILPNPSVSEASPDALEPIPLLDLTAQNGPLLPAVREAFDRLFAKNAFVLGSEVEAFEQEIAASIGCAHAIGVSSGTDALIAALMALGVGQGDEVVTTSFTFFATGGAIARLGAKPVFVDIDPVTFNLDLGQVPAAVTERTRAIMPVHLYGQPCDMSILRELAGAFSIPLIEDAAQSIGAVTDYGQAGTLGAIGCFSFYPTKNLGGFGDAGLCTTDDSDLALRLRMLRVHGSRQRYVHELVGGNFRIDALQAAVLRVKLPYLAGWIEARREHASLYDLLFLESGLAPQYVTTPKRVAPGHTYHQYVIRVPEVPGKSRDELRAFLTSRKIGTDVYYPIPLHQQHCFASLNTGPLPETERAAREVLALPIFAELRIEQVERVVDTIAEFFEL